ncbi:MAG TPA: serine/threonine-protein kinase [Polyangia bacterium]|nr:serine/threonine-protein kinase [Polyangia bacterium]
MGSDKENDRAVRESWTDVERPPATLARGGADPLPPGTVLAGRYQLGQLIGRGGMGVVVEALDRVLGVAVAIKIVRAEYAGERSWSERLAREVKLARQIQHPNVCRVFDYAQADGRAFLIMELATGGTLRSQLGASAVRARPLGERIADARAIAAGVAAIHAAGIVHRDISPQNALRMGDGRLVVSDFGLATDSFDGTTSIHGGTVAYMAPEVVGGGRSSLAADIWSLGAVIHEVVFGERFRWDVERGEMRSPVNRRGLSRVEGSLLEICCACLALNPARRPRAGVIAERLTEASLLRAGRMRWTRRGLVALAAGLVVAGGMVGARRIHSIRRRATEAAAGTSDPLMIVPAGQPEDWTDKARVLAEVPDKIRCLSVLPDHHTVRFVWGDRGHAEDLDTRTGERRPSPLVADAYAEGCPDVSPDGKWLVYAGHTADERPFAFVSTHADGRDGVAEVQTAEPSVDSDPVWLADGETFVYDVDDRHVAAFSMSTRRSIVMPTVTAPLYTSFHAALGNQIIVSSFLRAGGVEISGFGYPRLDETLHWRTPLQTLDLETRDGRRYYSAAFWKTSLALLETEPARGRARLVGAVPGQSLRHARFVDDGMVLTSVRRTSVLVSRLPGQPRRDIPVAEDVWQASLCGTRLVGTQLDSRGSRTVWLDAEGRVVGHLRESLTDNYPRCSSDGKVMFYSSYGAAPGIRRCDAQGCRTISTGASVLTALSPDDRRLAFVTYDSGPRAVRWMSADGTGPVHQIAELETGCTPIWSSPTLLWISHRKGRRLVWTELDTDSGRATGRTSAGRHDCMDGRDDPAKPLHDPVEIQIGSRSEIRLLPSKYLPTG